MFSTKTLPTSDFQRHIVILLNKPENSKCFDCQSRIPSYVNLTHGTFVCMLCSSLLRELGHQVKSIANPSFSAEEVHRMAQGGNNEASKVWLNNWNQYQAINSLRLQDVSSIKIHLREKYLIKRWYREPATSRSLSLSTSSLAPTSFSTNSNPRAAPYNSGKEKKFSKPIVSANEAEDVMFVKTLPRPKKHTEIQRSYTTSFVDDFSSLNIQQRQPETILDQSLPTASLSFDAFMPQVTKSIPIHSNQKQFSSFQTASQNFFDNFTNCPFDNSANFYQTKEPPLTQSAPQVNQTLDLQPNSQPSATNSFSSTSSFQKNYFNNPFAEDTFVIKRNVVKPNNVNRPPSEVKETSTGSAWVAFS